MGNLILVHLKKLPCPMGHTYQVWSKSTNNVQWKILKYEFFYTRMCELDL